MKFYYQLLFLLLVTFLLIGCNKENPSEPTSSPYDNASFSKGGIMFDKFWATESGFDQTNSNLAAFNAHSDFFRCKACHGWDLLGNTGSYIGRGAKTTRPAVAGLNLYQIAKSKTAQELFDAMKKSTGRRDVSYDLTQYDPTSNNTTGNQMPNYSQILTDAQIWDIVKFIKEGAFDVSQLYDATYTGTYPTGSAKFSNIGKDGNGTNGKSFFTQKCSSCHGADGRTITLEGMTAGKFIRSKPNEVQHKVKYGQLGSAMPGDFNMSLSQMKDLYKAATDTLTFPN